MFGVMVSLLHMMWSYSHEDACPWETMNNLLVLLCLCGRLFLSLSYPTIFLSSTLLIPSPVSLVGDWVNDCLVLGFWLGLNHSRHLLSINFYSKKTKKSFVKQ